MILREAQPADIPEIAELRAGDWGTADYWKERISAYLNAELDPKDAFGARVAFICEDSNLIVGLIAGHLTRRFGCDGELQWISVRAEHRNRGIATQFLGRLADWFVAHGAKRVCVDVEPANAAARRFYARRGAKDLRPHWMFWEDIGAARS